VNSNRSGEILTRVNYQSCGSSGGKAGKDWLFEEKHIGNSQPFEQKFTCFLSEFLVFSCFCCHIFRQQNGVFIEICAQLSGKILSQEGFQ